MTDNRNKTTELCKSSTTTEEDERLLAEYQKELSKEGLGLGFGIRKLINGHRSMHQHIKQMYREHAENLASAYKNGFTDAVGAQVVSIEELRDMTLQEIVGMLDKS